MFLFSHTHTYLRHLVPTISSSPKPYLPRYLTPKFWISPRKKNHHLHTKTHHPEEKNLSRARAQERERERESRSRSHRSEPGQGRIFPSFPLLCRKKNMQNCSSAHFESRYLTSPYLSSKEHHQPLSKKDRERLCPRRLGNWKILVSERAPRRTHQEGLASGETGTTKNPETPPSAIITR